MLAMGDTVKNGSFADMWLAPTPMNTQPLDEITSMKIKIIDPNLEIDQN